MHTHYSTAVAVVSDAYREAYLEAYLDALIPPRPESRVLWGMVHPHGRPMAILPGAALWRVRRGIERKGACR